MGSKFSFSEQREQSYIKTTIVIKYFDAWVKILSKRNPKIAYIDLFSGPGIYNDGTESTPILILKHIINDPFLASKVVTIFNEKDEQLFSRLKNNIECLDNIQALKFKPAIHNTEVDYNTPKEFMSRLIPCFSFIDPAGYYGLSLDLIKALGKDYGSDILFFFNYNDINRGITNYKVESNLEHLFGKKHFGHIKGRINNVPDGQRESFIVNQMAEAIKESGLSYVLPFRFKFEVQNRTSHYIIFASKNITGFNIMKEIMYGAGEKDPNKIGRFEFIPSCDKNNFFQLSILDAFNVPFETFKIDLCKRFQGQQLTVKEIYQFDSPNTPFVKPQYKEAIRQLEQEGKVICSKPFSERRRNTLADYIVVTFND